MSVRILDETFLDLQGQTSIQLLHNMWFIY